MRVVTWNIGKRSGKALEGVVAALRAAAPDLLLLQEVTRASLDSLAPLRMLGLQHVASAVDEAERAGKYAASVVFSRWPLTRVPSGWARAPVKTDPALAPYKRLLADWDGSAPRPWLLLRVTLKAPSGSIDVIDSAAICSPPSSRPPSAWSASAAAPSAARSGSRPSRRS
jgi:hypothetical protein